MTSTADPTSRFSDRAAHYAAHRPGYPPALLDLLEAELGLTAQTVAADVGSGTGILTAALLGRGCRVTAVEPNAEMRRVAERQLAGVPGFRSLDGRAEATGLEAGSVDLVAAAQAFHWFRIGAARREFHRILRAGGRVALIWNRRLTEGTAFLVAYEDLLQRRGIDCAEVDHRRSATPEVLGGFFGGGGHRQASLPHHQELDWPGLRGRALSSSYFPGPDHPQHGAAIAELCRVFDRTQRQGLVRIQYETDVYWGGL